MRILIANDDGIQAYGIRALAQRLAFDHEVYVIAPDRERSAAGHALTLHRPLRVEEVSMGFEVAKAWEISGTPGDCVKIGISSILDIMPDFVISGINHGPNLGADIIYSGTVSAAMEGAILGFPSIAMSYCGTKDYDPQAFTYSADFIAKFLKNIKEINFPKKTILNVNIPAVSPNEVTGLEITRLGTRMYTDAYEKRVDPRGKVYYWLAGEIIDSVEEEGTDITAIRNNKISITPVTFEMTNSNIMSELENAFCNGKCVLF
jgi:5'-nucleotidase